MAAHRLHGIPALAGGEVAHACLVALRCRGADHARTEVQAGTCASRASVLDGLLVAIVAGSAVNQDYALGALAVAAGANGVAVGSGDAGNAVTKVHT